MSSFQTLSRQLKESGISQPTLVIDKAQLNNNIRILSQTLQKGFAYRIVVKSLPCLPLIDEICRQTESQRFMCFHGPFIQQIAKAYPEGDILLGKPLPEAAFEALVVWFQNQKTSNISQVQWLIDSPLRLEQYRAIAQKHKVSLRINLEIDVGLHRGGFALDEDFDEAIAIIENSQALTFSGLMGYEAHASKIPSFLGGMRGALKDSWQLYELFKSKVAHLSDKSTCFNSGGSTTFTEYDSKAPCNELSVGSALLKPSDFDLPHLGGLTPAAFIATPLLKRVDDIDLPGPKLGPKLVQNAFQKTLHKALQRAGQLPGAAGYIYGGNWLATPCYPESARQISLFGRSSNQELYGFDEDCDLIPDDLMLFRPKQSEAVLLQFGDIAVFDEGKISDWWMTLCQSQLTQSALSQSDKEQTAKPRQGEVQ
jgi:D-serine deaminase-like pyridoxal phosphate-dependent protein